MSGIDSIRPRVLPPRLFGRTLTPEERFLVDRIDGARTVSELGHLTGLEGPRIVELVARLAADGFVELEAPFDARGLDAADLDVPDDRPTIEDFDDEPTIQAAAPSPSGHPPAREPTEPEAPAQALEGGELAGADEDAPDAEAEDAAASAGELDYRKHYETRWHPLPVEQRAEAARTCTGADLHALTLDPSPQVIAGILENSTCGLDHVRRIAFHHRTAAGLELVARRHDWLRDGLVERRLLRNPMIGELVLGRVMGPKRLLATYKIAVDRDVPDVSRAKCRGHLRQKWQTAPPEERAELLLRTEARCLTLMTGCTFDAKTTSILCGRTVASAMFIQSVAKFGAAPPALLAHLVKQPFVRKNVPLRRMLLAHPNMPGDAKRSLS